MNEVFEKSIVVIGTFFSLLPITTSAAPVWTKTFHCQEYTITLNENPQGNYNYQARSKYGNLNLSRGKLENTEGVRVFKFKNANTEYWVWDGTLDSSVAGVLEVYQNNRQILSRNCHQG